MVQAKSVADNRDPVVSRSGTSFSPERAVEALASRWSLLIFREALLSGTTNYAEFERNLGVPEVELTSRLDVFVATGLMERTPVDSSEDAAAQYVLTARGRNLLPTVVALASWEDGWLEDPREHSSGAGLRIEFSLLGSFSVRIGGKSIEDLSVGSQRLLVFLALHDRAVARTVMAQTMWPEATGDKAGVSLRSALSRLDVNTRDAILSASAGLQIAADVSIDYRDAQALAHRLTSHDVKPTDDDLNSEAVGLLSEELLPDWYDDWVIAEAEDWRQLRINALEALADHLVIRDRLAEAAVVARAAMRVEPLRESAHACLIKVHLAMGNQSEALRVYDRYVELLHTVLNLEPTPLITELISDLRKRW
jgi:DNA-binding SARP family transcriptional activator/DNA-binding HxlR family transcriptional regulator